MMGAAVNMKFGACKIASGTKSRYLTLPLYVPSLRLLGVFYDQIRCSLNNISRLLHFHSITDMQQ